MSYIDLKYKPIVTDVITEFYLEPASGVTLKEASEAVAGESSVGTWTELDVLQRSSMKRLMPHVFEVNQNTNQIKIAYPISLFEIGNVPQLLSSIGGNVFGMKAVKNLRLEDIRLPSAYVSRFKGPAFGIEGVRKLTKVYGRPLLGTIIKPKLGLNAKEHALSAYESWIGGMDVVKDDENLTDMKFNRFRDRVSATLAKRDKAEKETGEKKIYFENITAPYNEMVERAKFVKSLGGEFVMIDILTTGWSALQAFRNLNLGLAIHSHRAGHAMFTRNPYHGISMKVIAKLARLIGTDTLHTGTAGVGKMQEEPTAEVNKVLKEKLKYINPTLPVASGGLYPGAIPKLVDILGRDIVIQMGGGIHSNLLGTLAGARAARQAVDAMLLGIHLNQYAATHRELRQAIEQWGIPR